MQVTHKNNNQQQQQKTDITGLCVPQIDNKVQGIQTVVELSVDYTDILSVDLQSKELFVPASNAKPTVATKTSNHTDVYDWLHNSKTCMEIEECGPPKSVSWSAFYD